MQKNYDFTNAERGKFSRSDATVSLPIYLEPNMNTPKKEVMTVTASVYKLTKQFSELRVESQELKEDDPRFIEINDQMDLLSLGIVNHLLANELRVIQ